jgi:hypothetical protein
MLATMKKVAAANKMHLPPIAYTQFTLAYD